MNFELLRSLAKHASHRTAPENYTVENVDAAFAGELAKFCTDINTFLENRYKLYAMVIENVDDIVPKKVIDALGVVAKRLSLREDLVRIELESSLLRLVFLVYMRHSV